MRGANAHRRQYLKEMTNLSQRNKHGGSTAHQEENRGGKVEKRRFCETEHFYSQDNVVLVFSCMNYWSAHFMFKVKCYPREAATLCFTALFCSQRL
jgi:hypothetical protein